MSCIPLSPLNHTGEISAYKAGADAIASSLSEGKFDNNRRSSDEKGRNGRNTPHQLPPLATNKAGGVLGESTEDQDDDVSAAGKDEHEVSVCNKRCASFFSVCSSGGAVYGTGEICNISKSHIVSLRPVLQHSFSVLHQRRNTTPVFAC